MHRFVPALMLVFFWATSCSLDDHLNCPLGFERSTELLEVEVIPKDGGAPQKEKVPVEVCIEPYDTGPDEVETDTGPEPDSETADGGGDDAGTDTAPITGLGEPCSAFGKGGDCAGFEADFCAFDPFSETGYCTYENCTADSCPEEVPTCADCSKIDSDLIWGIACLKGAEAMLAQANGCDLLN